MDEWYYLSLLFCVWLADKFFYSHTRVTDLSVSRMYLRFTTRITLQNFRLTIPNALGADFESPPDFCIPRPSTVWNGYASYKLFLWQRKSLL